MNFDEDIKELLALMIKMVSSDYSVRKNAYNQAKHTVKRIQKAYDQSIDLLNDLSSKVVKIAKESKEAKKELAFFKIAAGEMLEEELNTTVKHMKEAVEYYIKESLHGN